MSDALHLRVGPQLFALVLGVGQCFTLNRGSAQDLEVISDHANGVYQPGDSIHWRVEWKGESPATQIDYTIKQGGLKPAASGSVALTGGVADVQSRLDEPGSLLLEVTLKSADGKRAKAAGGAMIRPEKITPSAGPPNDFADFWDAKLKELAAVSPNPQLEKSAVKKPDVDYWKVTFDNIRGTHIHGQLARPTTGEKLPALLIPQWAGVYPLQQSWATDRAAEGWLVLNISAHDLLIDASEDFYQQQLAGPLKDYWAIGNDDRETSYFLRMYLSCCQAVRYLTERSDWDGTTLVVSGGSQGGQQSLITAALCPQVTAALSIVPAGSDELGPTANRSPGWPQWYWQTSGKDAEKVREAGRYFDVTNFARRIKCPVLFGLGLIDQVCPPAGEFATINQILAPKEVVILPQAEHQEIQNSHRAYYDRWGIWMSALRKGEMPPIKQFAAADDSAATATSQTDSADVKPAAETSTYLPPTRASYLKLAEQVELALHRDVLDVWFPRCVDDEHGGFYSNFSRDWQRTTSEGKFSVFQGRMTWITAQVSMQRPELKDRFLPYTVHGLKFLNDVMWDSQSGGIFWGLDDDGHLAPAFGDDKQLYGIGFCLYAAAANYQATKDPAALDLAQRIFRWVDEHAHDTSNGGYFEWLTRDGKPIPPDPTAPQPVLRSGLPVGGKSMNTHIHYLEALTQLYESWPDANVRDRLTELQLIVRDKICRDPGVMNLYFTNDWQPTARRDSYGHDIETAFLLLDAAKALNATDDAQTLAMARMVVDHSIQTAWDERHGGLFREGPMLGKPDDLKKEWWVQFETLNSLLLMHELHGRETQRYFNLFQDQWRFIQNSQIDREDHGTYDTLQPDGKPATDAKGRIWKAAYHDGRALMNVSDRLNALAAQQAAQ